MVTTTVQFSAIQQKSMSEPYRKCLTFCHWEGKQLLTREQPMDTRDTIAVQAMETSSKTCVMPSLCSPHTSLCVLRWSRLFYSCSCMLLCCFHIVFLCFPSACCATGVLLECPVPVVSVVVAVGQFRDLHQPRCLP
jgi:hypothetical protein